MAIRNNIREEDKDELSVGKILVIDDEPSIRKSLRGILRKHNYSVDTAEGYEDAKDRLFKEGYDALILDLILICPQLC